MPNLLWQGSSCAIATRRQLLRPSNRSDRAAPRLLESAPVGAVLRGQAPELLLCGRMPKRRARISYIEPSVFAGHDISSRYGTTRAAPTTRPHGSCDDR